MSLFWIISLPLSLSHSLFSTIAACTQITWKMFSHPVQTMFKENKSIISEVWGYSGCLCSDRHPPTGKGLGMMSGREHTRRARSKPGGGAHSLDTNWSQSYSDYMANICESVQWCNMLCLVPHEKQNQIKGQILFFISQICQMSGFICIL